MAKMRLPDPTASIVEEESPEAIPVEGSVETSDKIHLSDKPTVKSTVAVVVVGLEDGKRFVDVAGVPSTAFRKV